MRSLKLCCLKPETFQVSRMLLMVCVPDRKIEPVNARFEEADIVMIERSEDLKLQKPASQKMFFLAQAGSRKKSILILPPHTFVCYPDEEDTGVAKFGAWFRDREYVFRP